MQQYESLSPMIGVKMYPSKLVSQRPRVNLSSRAPKKNFVEVTELTDITYTSNLVKLLLHSARVTALPLCLPDS